MKKKIRLVIVLLSLGFLVYCAFLVISALFYMITKPSNDLSDVVKSTKMVDSLYFSESTLANLAVEYSSELKDGRYMTSFTYMNKYRFVVRKLNTDSVNLLTYYRPIFESNTVDLRVTYDVEYISPFKYKIDVDRKNFNNKNIIIDGKNIDILKNTKDTLLIHGKIYDVSIGTHDKYVNEGVYLEDETFFRKPVEVELLILNKENGLFFHLLFSLDNQRIPSGLIQEIK